jgi:hypothetical protein
MKNLVDGWQTGGFHSERKSQVENGMIDLEGQAKRFGQVVRQ